MKKEYIFDIEGNGLLNNITQIFCIVFLDVHTGKRLPFRGGKNLHLAKEIFENADTLIGHNIVDYDLRVLFKLLGWKPKLECSIRDTLLMSHICFKNSLIQKDASMQFQEKKIYGQHGLDAWGIRERYYKQVVKNNDFSVFTPQIYFRCMRDTKLNKLIYDRFMKHPNMNWEVYDLEYKVQLICNRQEEYGWKLDIEKAEKLQLELIGKKYELISKLKESFPDKVFTKSTPSYYKFSFNGVELTSPNKGSMSDLIKEKKKELNWKQSNKYLFNLIEVGEYKKEIVEFNPNSSDNIAEGLLVKYGFVPKIMTLTGKPTFDEDLLRSLPYSEAQWIADYRFTFNSRLTYLESYLESAKNDGRVHGRVRSYNNNTWRASHVKPNVSNVPKPGVSYGKEFRELFIC